MFNWGKKKKNEEEQTTSSQTVTSSLQQRTVTVNSTVTQKVTKGGSLRVYDNHFSHSKEPRHDISQFRFSDGREHIVTDSSVFQPPSYTLGNSRNLNQYRSVYTTTPYTAPKTPPIHFRSNSLSAPSPTLYNIKGSNASLNTNPTSQQLIIKVKPSIKFHGVTSKVPTYTTKRKQRGKLLIINNMNFDDQNDRKGAEVDESNLKELFKQMKFEVEDHKNKKAAEMRNIVTKYSNSKSLKKFDVNVVVIMSHGWGTIENSQTDVTGTDGQSLSTSWIIDQFDTNCTPLHDKPKIFIFQCCRGPNVDKVEHDAVVFQKPRKYADMLVAYSTVQGHISHRQTSSGSWYVRLLCQIFMEHAHDTDVENMLKMVDAKLSDLSASGSRQTSSYENRGFKTCYLHPGLWEN